MQTNQPASIATANDQATGEPGTLVWVGETSHPEFVDAFKYCYANVAQLALRQDLQEFCDRPAGYVRRIMFARVDRRPVSPSVLHEISRRYVNAQSLALTSSLCDGEGRTGMRWPVVEHLRFSRWRECLPTWLEPCGCRERLLDKPKTIVVIADRYEVAEPLLDVASDAGISVSWSRRAIMKAHRQVDLVIWDDSVASATTANGWRQRLDACTSASRSTRHFWLALHPQIEEINAAWQGGIYQTFTKPLCMHSLFQ